jgi:hypothetical protein
MIVLHCLALRAFGLNPHFRPPDLAKRETVIRQELALLDFAWPKTPRFASPGLRLTGRSVYIRLNKQPETKKIGPWRAHLMLLRPSSCRIGKGRGPQQPGIRATDLQAEVFSGRSRGKRITSRIECELVRSMARRSTPIPSPPVGGIP